MHGLMREGRREPVLYSTLSHDPMRKVLEKTGLKLAQMGGCKDFCVN